MTIVKLMLIEWFLPEFIYLSTFWYCILKLIPYLYASLIRARKFSWGSILFFVQVYSHKMLLFFIFHEALVPVTAKTTDVNNSLWFLLRVKTLMQAILFMLDESFVVWLWPQLNLCSVYQVIFVSKIDKKYQST